MQSNLRAGVICKLLDHSLAHATLAVPLECDMTSSAWLAVVEAFRPDMTAHIACVDVEINDVCTVQA